MKHPEKSVHKVIGFNLCAEEFVGVGLSNKCELWCVFESVCMCCSRTLVFIVEPLFYRR